MKRSLSIFTLVLLFYGAFAQNRTFTLSVFYAINEVRSEAGFKRIDSLIYDLSKKTFSLEIYGYADYLNTDAYNEALSRKRAEEVKKYLLIKSPGLKISTCKGMGEKNSKDNSSPQGEASQRRVDLVITEQIHVKKISTRENIIHEEKKEIREEPVKVRKNDGAKELEDLEKGETMAIEGLNFIPGRHMLVKNSMPVLEELLETLKEHPTIKIEIQGHICCLITGEEDALDYDSNEKQLSTNRAKTVYNYLIRNGISADRLTYKGYGHTNPKISPETTPEEEQVNRRVEIKILEN